MSQTSTHAPRSAPSAHGLQQIGSPDELRAAFGCFPSGVLAVCAMADDGPVGMAASSFTPISLSPTLVSVCIQNTSATWPVLREAPRLGLSVLADHQDRQCATLARKQGDRFSDVDWRHSGGGAVFIEGASLWLDCTLSREIPAGDHVLVLLEVLAVRADRDRDPLVFHGSRFRRLAGV